jgi:tRNA 2-thiocytidine biosynthesis protein TtcA
MHPELPPPVPSKLAQQSPEFAKLERKLTRSFGRAVREFRMIEPNDRILCAVSGGKDSYTMHHLLLAFQTRAPFPFEVVAVNIDQGHPGYPADRLQSYMDQREAAFRMVHEDTYSIVTEKIPEGKTYCSLCSRLRRGILYRLAQEMKCTKIALGHHRDDAVVTLMLNLVFSGQLKSMPPKLMADDGINIVIRPLLFCAEDDIRAYSDALSFPILPCDLCGSQTGLQRKVVSDLLAQLETLNPGVRSNMLAALANVRPTHLLDAQLWKQLGLEMADELPATTLAPHQLLRSV